MPLVSQNSFNLLLLRPNVRKFVHEFVQVKLQGCFVFSAAQRQIVETIDKRCMTMSLSRDVMRITFKEHGNESNECRDQQRTSDVYNNYAVLLYNLTHTCTSLAPV